MKVLVVGGGGREHAIAWKLSKENNVEKIYCAPGNAGIAKVAQCVNISDSDIENLVKFAKENNILIIHDNAYSDIIYDGKEGKSFLSFPGAKEVGVEFYSLSKSYNYTGARMSFVIGNAKVIEVFKRFRSQIDYGIFLPVQAGAVAALYSDDTAVKEQCAAYQERRDALCGGLLQISQKCQLPQPSGSAGEQGGSDCYFFGNIRADEGGKDFYLTGTHF